LPLKEPWLWRSQHDCIRVNPPVSTIAALSERRETDRVIAFIADGD
jgi:hypothetical protein